MKKLTSLLTLLLGLLLSFNAAATTIKIVALVNGEIISNEDMDSRLNAFLMTTRIPFNPQTQNMIMQRVLNSAIDEKIKLQEAGKNGINITDEEVKSALNQYAKSHNIPNGQLNSVLKASHISPSAFAEQMKSDLAWLRVVRKKHYADGSLTQKEINKALAEAQADLTTPKYMVSEIFIKKENARNLSELVYNLRHDNRFELYAMQFSDSASAANGGNLGWINQGKLPSALETTLKKMSVGEISEPVMVGDGYYILKLQRTFDPQKDQAEIPDEKTIKTFLENQKMEALSKRLLQDLRQKAVIEIRG